MKLKKIFMPVAGAVIATGLVMTGQSQAVEYNPNPQTAGEAVAQMDNLADSKAFLHRSLGNFLDQLQTSAPYAALDGTEAKTCFTLNSAASFGFNYGAGQINTDLMELQQVEAREENGVLVPAESVPGNYFTTTADFMKQYYRTISNLDYQDIVFPDNTFVGCVQDAAQLRDMQSYINSSAALHYNRRMEARMEQDMGRFSDVLHGRPSTPPGP